MHGASISRSPVARFFLATLFATAVVATAHAQDAKTDGPAAAAPPAVAAPASPAEVIVPPSDPVAKTAFDVLDKHCARCHQSGKLVKRERPAKGFGNVLKLDEMAANPHFIRPGNPLDSYLLRQILDKQMPYDVYQEYSDQHPTPTESDLRALEAWVNGLGAKAVASCESHKLISPDDMVRFMVTDLDKQLRQRQPTTRYLTLTHLANICTDPAAMKVYRQAAIKFLNSLGRSSDVIRLETIDPEGTILRFNLLDLGWSAADWDGLIAMYPYNVQPQTEFSRTLASATRTPQAYVRADWFAFTASEPPLYDALLKLPNTFQDLAREQGVNVEAHIRNFVAQRAGFQKSGVSQNNRLIERHPSNKGYFWTSYDFAGNRDRQSLFDFPLGPSGAKGFQHDGGETIFSLPNGFQAYYLNTASGERLDKGPTTIVRDESRKDFTVTNGISCMGCHDQGMRKAKDEIRELVLGRRTFPADVRDAVDGLYPPREKMDAFIESDQKRFTGAMVQAGLEPALKLNGVEMINALAKRYDDDVDLALAAAELGIDKADFKQSSGDVDAKFRPMIRRLSQSSVPRDQFEAAFRELAPSLTDLKMVKIPGSKPTQHAAKPSHSDDLSLTSDADSYKVGDSPVFTVVSAQDCFLTLTDLDQKGEGTVLLPNAHQKDNRIKAGVPIQFPGPNAPFKFRMKDPGIETIVAVCATQANGGDRIRHDFQKDQFTSIRNYNDVLAKAIAIDPVTPGAKPAAGSAPATAPRPSSRAAIQVRVR
ncbi:DUF4384 domain-containing protein [Bradyrhizobium sp. LjRoot220]|uniref:DUF4384 domain-containing protein n=1 Tax=Bradyrhizobium sp. LjRoot220 TaxID=3342284 RepID=UPI003ECD42EB